MVSRAYGFGAVGPRERLIGMLKRGAMTRDQITSALGRSTASDTLTQLRKAGIVEEDGGEIRLKEPEAC